MFRKTPSSQQKMPVRAVQSRTGETSAQTHMTSHVAHGAKRVSPFARCHQTPINFHFSPSYPHLAFARRHAEQRVVVRSNLFCPRMQVRVLHPRLSSPGLSTKRLTARVTVEKLSRSQGHRRSHTTVAAYFAEGFTWSLLKAPGSTKVALRHRERGTEVSFKKGLLTRKTVVAVVCV
ncbi:hypothetical protein IscW_ISCW018500 [Ixodes scapularis]|uniref:Uncharacterized protein n=1 Tax=Ixodes scapularis TaxID=6945 RepID=B7PN03_IXOSC|nr:hypothetical protein IscW_ISCW018500 [Ixodes scapularis]|eukprot:XP_002435151.1 hypothetical protein IscW_ISCW018500 [Ixodes scapularis]